jgi:hypothetical protein
MKGESQTIFVRFILPFRGFLNPLLPLLPLKFTLMFSLIHSDTLYNNSLLSTFFQPCQLYVILPRIIHAPFCTTLSTNREVPCRTRSRIILSYPIPICCNNTTLTIDQCLRQPNSSSTSTFHLRHYTMYRPSTLSPHTF